MLRTKQVLLSDVQDAWSFYQDYLKEPLDYENLSELLTEYVATIQMLKADVEALDLLPAVKKVLKLYEMWLEMFLKAKDKAYFYQTNGYMLNQALWFYLSALDLWLSLDWQVAKKLPQVDYMASYRLLWQDCLIRLQLEGIQKYLKGAWLFRQDFNKRLAKNDLSYSELDELASDMYTQLSETAHVIFDPEWYKTTLFPKNSLHKLKKAYKQCRLLDDQLFFQELDKGDFDKAAIKTQLKTLMLVYNYFLIILIEKVLETGRPLFDKNTLKDVLASLEEKR